MTFDGVVVSAVVGIGLIVLHVGTVRQIRERCGRTRAERLLLVSDVLALSLVLFAQINGSLLPGVAALGLAACSHLSPLPVMRLGGGVDDLCLFRREARELFALLNQRPFTAAILANAQSRRQNLNRYRTPATSRTLDAIDAVFNAQFPSEESHDATLKAYDELDAALAELKAATPW